MHLLVDERKVPKLMTLKIDKDPKRFGWRIFGTGSYRYNEAIEKNGRP